MRILVCRQFQVLDKAVYDRQPYTWILDLWDSMTAESRASRRSDSNNDSETEPKLLPGMVQGEWPT